MQLPRSQESHGVLPSVERDQRIIDDDEGSSQLYLDGVGRVVPVTCFVGS
jgi:hypothetical protein